MILLCQYNPVNWVECELLYDPDTELYWAFIGEGFEDNSAKLGYDELRKGLEMMLQQLQLHRDGAFDE